MKSSFYLTFGAHGRPLGKQTLSEGGCGMGGGMTSSRSSGKGSDSRELSLSSFSSSSSRVSSALYGSFSLNASRLSCFIRAWINRVHFIILFSTPQVFIKYLCVSDLVFSPGTSLLLLNQVRGGRRWGRSSHASHHTNTVLWQRRETQRHPFTDLTALQLLKPSQSELGCDRKHTDHKP